MWFKKRDYLEELKAATYDIPKFMEIVRAAVEGSGRLVTRKETEEIYNILQPFEGILAGYFKDAKIIKFSDAEPRYSVHIKYHNKKDSIEQPKDDTIVDYYLANSIPIRPVLSKEWERMDWTKTFRERKLDNPQIFFQKRVMASRP